MESFHMYFRVFVISVNFHNPDVIEIQSLTCLSFELVLYVLSMCYFTNKLPAFGCFLKTNWCLVICT